MNARQAIALAIGTILAIALVMTPPLRPPLRVQSSQRLPNGAIQTVESRPVPSIQPVAFVLIVLVTGLSVWRLRKSSEEEAK